MPFDTLLSLALIGLTLGVLFLRTHVGLGILLMLSSHLVVVQYFDTIDAFLTARYDVFSTVAVQITLTAALTFLPAVIIIARLGGTTSGRFLSQFVPALLLVMLFLSLLSSTVYGADEFSYVRNSYLAHWLVLLQGWIVSLSLIGAFVDVIGQYKSHARGRKGRFRLWR